MHGGNDKKKLNFDRVYFLYIKKINDGLLQHFFY